MLDDKDEPVKITFLGTTSDTGNCPTTWETDRDTLLVQGSTVTDPALLEQIRQRSGNGIPAYESVVEIPKALVKFLPPVQ
jgi:hypothetical protein